MFVFLHHIIIILWCDMWPHVCHELCFQDNIELELSLFFSFTANQHNTILGTRIADHIPESEGAKHNNTMLQVWSIIQFNNAANAVFSIMLCYIFSGEVQCVFFPLN